MQLGEVIRKYRKENHLTQKEVAIRLGVSTPTVNKWENGNSFPDIMLLAPIARLFGISTDILLSYQEEMTQEEINELVLEMDVMIKEQSYQECFKWAKKKVEQYPNCEQLLWQIAVILDAQRMFQGISNSEVYEEYCCSLYNRVLESKDEMLRTRAADSLFNYYMRKKDHDKAKPYLGYISIENPERKIKKARLLAETERIEEAYKTFEELLYANYTISTTAMHGIYMLALKANNMEKAHSIVEKQIELAKCFEMGKYYETSSRLEIATIEKDTETIIDTMNEMLANIEDISGFSNSKLYEHMDFKEVSKEFVAELKANLKKCFQDDEAYGFLKDDKRWQKIVE